LYNNDQNNQPVPWPGDPGPNFSPNCAFQAPSPTQFPPVRNTGQANTYWYGDAILMLQIAGAPYGNYVTWKNTDLPPNTNPYWSFHKANNVNCDFVYEVCTCTSVTAPGANNCLPVPKTQCGLN